MENIMTNIDEQKGLIIIGGFRVGMKQEGIVSESGVLRTFVSEPITKEINNESILERLRNFSFLSKSAYKYLKKNHPALNKSLDELLLDMNGNVTEIHNNQFETTFDINFTYKESEDEVSMYTFNVSLSQWRK